MPVFVEDYLIEVPEIEFDPTDPRWIELCQTSIWKEYPGWEGDGYPFELCSLDSVNDSSIVKHYKNVFKDFDLRWSNYISKQTSPGDGGDPEARANQVDPTLVKGTLIKGNIADRPILPHIDATRTAGFVFPLTLPADINFHSGRCVNEYEDIVYTHEYKPVITILNSGNIWHSVSTKQIGNPRYSFQLDCYNTWEEIVDLINTL